MNVHLSGPPWYLIECALSDWMLPEILQTRKGDNRNEVSIVIIVEPWIRRSSTNRSQTMPEKVGIFLQVWIYMTMLLKTWQTSHKKDRISEMRRSTRHKSVILYIVVMSASKILIAQKIWHLFKLSKLDVLWSNNIYHFINPISLHEGARPARAVKV